MARGDFDGFVCGLKSPTSWDMGSNGRLAPIAPGDKLSGVRTSNHLSVKYHLVI